MTEQAWNILYSLADITDNYDCIKCIYNMRVKIHVLPYRYHIVLTLERPICKCCLDLHFKLIVKIIQNA
jgi:hypothetical protein